MINASNAYKEMMDRKIRNRIHVSVVIGIINSDAQENAELSGDSAYWSLGNVFGSNTFTNEYATLEENFMKADGSMLFLPEDNELIQLKPNGFTTKDLLGSVRIDLNSRYSIKGITLDFGHAYPTSFTLETDNGVHLYTNNSNIFVSDDVYGEISYIIITPTEMNGGRQRMRLKRVSLGVGLQYTNQNTKSLTMKENVSPISAEIPNQTVNYTLYDDNGQFDVDDDNSYIDYLETLQKISVSFGVELDDGSIDWNQIATTYLKDWRTQRDTVTLASTDRISFLDGTYTIGNKIHTRTAYDEAKNILYDAGLSSDEYHIDDYLKTIELINPVPECAHKEALQILANACRCKIKQDEFGQIIIVPNFATTLDSDEVLVSTNDVAEWSNPNNLLVGSDLVYAELLPDFMKADGSMFFIPENKAYLKTSYVSESISDENGLFEVNPQITFTMPAAYSYYGTTIIFGGNPPKKINIKTYNGSSTVQDVDYIVSSEIFNTYQKFDDFDKMVISVIEGSPNNRVIINKVVLGALSDYVLKKQNMMEIPVGFKEKRVKELNVKIFSFAEDSDGIPVEIEDEVYYTRSINSVGETKVVSNPLISNEEHAALVADWIGNYYANNVSYDVRYRGEPTLNATDVIRMESEKIEGLQVEILSHNLTFNGALSGNLELRRASNMTGG